MSAEGLPFGFFEKDRAWNIWSFTTQFDQVEDAPSNDHIHSQTSFDAAGAAQLTFFDLAATLQRAMVNFDPPTAGIPGEFFDSLRAVGHLTTGQQHPRNGLDTFRYIDFLSQHGPHGQRL